MSTLRIWKIIPGFDKYKVSSDGKVRHIKKTYNLGTQENHGYLSVIIHDNKCKKHKIKVHQLVAMAFLNHKRCGMISIIDHLDNNKRNNHYLNLEISTPRRNLSRLGGLSKFPGVTLNKKKTRFRARITINGKRIHLGNFLSEEEASEAYNKKLKEHEQK